MAVEAFDGVVDYLLGQYEKILPSEQRSVRSASLEDECTPGRVYDYLARFTGNNLKKP